MIFSEVDSCSRGSGTFSSMSMFLSGAYEILSPQDTQRLAAKARAHTEVFAAVFVGHVARADASECRNTFSSVTAAKSRK